MRTKTSKALVAALLTVGTLAGKPALALQVSGLNPLFPIDGVAVTSVEAGSLRLSVQGGGILTVRPWPVWLPQQVGPQRVHASRQLHPAGPVDTLKLQASGESEPWLALAVGARPGQAIIGDWRLEREDGRWLLRHGKHQRQLGEQATVVRVEGATWCIYLGEERVSTPTSGGVVLEQETQADVVAVRAAHVTGGCDVRQGGQNGAADDASA